MANRLKKLAEARYTPGTPYQPAVQAYCIQVAQVVPGHWEYDPIVYATAAQYQAGVPPVRASSPHWVPTRTTYREVCFPSSPAVPAVPDTTTYTAINGWNGGARSVNALTGNGYFGFYISAGTIATVVGLSASDLDTLPNEPTHAFYVHGTTVDIMESGVVVATAPTPHDATKQCRIIRSGTTINYAYNGWTYTSSVPSSGPRFLDAAIYASGDYVDSPSLNVEQDIGATAVLGSISALGLTVAGVGYLRGINQVFGSVDRAYVNDNGAAIDLRGIRQVFGSTGSADMRIDYKLSATQVFGSTQRVRLAYTGAANDPVPAGYAVGSAQGTLPKLLGSASQAAYSYALGTLPPLGGEAAGGFPEVSLAYCYGIMPALSGFAHLLTGQVGTASGTLGSLSGWAAQNPYGEARGTLPALSGNANDGDVQPNTKTWSSGLITADFFIADLVASGIIRDGLTLQGSLSASLVVGGDLVDALMLVDTLSAQYAIDALIRSGLALGSAGVAADAAAAQYAVNVLTGALGVYAGFDFTGFAQAGTAVYGAKADGVYLIRHGSDNGVPIGVTIDFGDTDFGAPQAKTVESIYLGITTDGQVIAKLRVDDGPEQIYRVLPRGEAMRAAPAKGLRGRRWNLTLEIIDATSFELDSVEQFVAVSATRRAK